MTNLVNLNEYKVACLSYNKAIELLKELVDVIHGVKEEFSLQVAHVQFDLILQTAMYEAVTEMGGFTPLRKEFVQYVPHEGDILEVVNTASKAANPDWKDITWEDAVRFDETSKKAFLTDVKILISPAVGQFTAAFGFIDGVMQKRDIYEELREKVGAILYALFALGEDRTDADKSAPLPGFRTYQELTLPSWKAARLRANGEQAVPVEPPAKA